MYTEDNLNEMGCEQLVFIASSGFGLNLDEFDAGGGFLKDQPQIQAILAKQDEVVRSLPPGLIDQALVAVQRARDNILILKHKESNFYWIATVPQWMGERDSDFE